MNQQQFFEKVIDLLEEYDISYMITGSVGAMIYGIPRMTNDLDIVIDSDPEKVYVFLEQFSKDLFYYPPKSFVEEQIKIRGQFNIIHTESGSKVDIVIRKNLAFSIREFSNRRKVVFSATRQADSAAPEDIIISKLSFYKKGRSEKHLNDIRGMIGYSREVLDISYIEEWVLKLDLEDIWDLVKNSS